MFIWHRSVQSTATAYERLYTVDELKKTTCYRISQCLKIID